MAHEQLRKNQKSPMLGVLLGKGLFVAEFVPKMAQD